MFEGGTPPYRIETERLVIRCWDPRDHAQLDEAVAESVEELRPWMQWAAEPLAEPPGELLRRFRGWFDLDQEFVYGLFSPDETEVLGGSGLHTRAQGGLEIGYWVRSSRARQGLATEAAAALTRVAIEHCGVPRVDIQVEPGNEASLRVVRKLGYREDGLLRRELAPLVRGGPRRDAIRFSMVAEELAGSPCAAVGYAAFDVLGRRFAS